MNIEKYLLDLVKEFKFKINDLDNKIFDEMVRIIKKFDKKNIKQIYLTGASEKQTNSKDCQTIELLISIKAKDPRIEGEIINNYMNYFISNDFKVKLNRYAICFKYKGICFEIIPTKLKLGTYNYHYLYDNISKGTTITNMNILKNDVLNSKCQDEIILLKLWRDKHQLQFPSIYIELVVISVLKKCEKKNLFSRLIRILDYLRKDFENDSYYDPSNSDNIISDALSKEEKEQIKECAKKSMTSDYIRDVIS